MDINNNQQVNTFVKGMDTDTSDMYIGEGSYRYAENLRVVTDGNSNSGELHIIEGTTRLLLSQTITGLLLGFTSIRQYAVAVVKQGETWSVYRIDTDGNVLQINTTPFSEKIWNDDWDDTKKVLSLVTRWESDETIKLYIADGIHPLMVINIATQQEGTFEEIFQATTKMLMPVEVTVTESDGANIPGVVLQYGYIIYKKRGASSTLSILSKAVVSSIDNVTGFGVDESSTHIVKLIMPEETMGRYVRIYRIAYSRSGLLPRVDIIYDQQCKQHEINDTGQSLLNVSTAEFIAENKLSISPANIESKGDYLFAANILYNLDTIDQQFILFDARCFSEGSYYLDNNLRVEIGVNADDETLANIPQDNIGHSQFDNADVSFIPEYWMAGEDGYNGHGLCFNWKYVYTDDILTIDNQYNSLQTPRTYARNEVYRFGVRLYDEQGRASSVKWIADIKMPDYFNPTGDETMKPYIEMRNGNRHVNNLSVQFVPRQSNLWNGVYKYEIVQAKRGIEDSYKLMLGVSGYLQKSYDNRVCMPYYLTTQRFDVIRGQGNDSGRSWSPFDEDWSYLHAHPYFVYEQYKNALLFIAPEYTYQPDDINALCKNYKTSMYIHTVATYDHPARTQYTTDAFFNHARAAYDNIFDSTPIYVADPIVANDHLSQLSVGIYAGGNNVPAGTYYLASDVMADWNYRSENTSNYEPKGGRKNDARKQAFFTNIVPTNVIQIPLKNNLRIESVTSFAAASPDDFAKDEKCTLDKKFTNLKSGIRFYNWTNPALLDQELLWLPVGTGNDDDLKEGWKDSTMTAYDDWYVNLKYNSYWPYGNWWTRYRGLLVNNALPFPTSPGGSGIILETGENTSSYFPQISSQSPEISGEEKLQVYPNNTRFLNSLSRTGSFYNLSWQIPINQSDIGEGDLVAIDVTFEDGRTYNATNSIGSTAYNGLLFAFRGINGASLTVGNYYSTLTVPLQTEPFDNNKWWGESGIYNAFTPNDSPLTLAIKMGNNSTRVCPINITIYKQHYDTVSLPDTSMPPVTITNVCKPATPYGGYNISAISNTLYVGEGYVSEPEDPITVSMGDNHITMYAHMLYHNFDNAQHDAVTSAAVQYIVPIESTMDLTKTCSNYIQITHQDTLPVPGNGAWIQVNPSTVAGRFTLTTDLYLYNTAYSVVPDIVTLAAEDKINAVGSRNDSRVHYSQQKQNNELIDNWTNFKAINYLDVDSRYGQITGLKLFKDKLIFLQENGAGVLSVNDRIILKDLNSANIIVGNGGVLDRYDYFTTIYGMKPDQHAVEASNDSLYWWDGYRKEIISYTDGYNVNLLQRIKNVADYINNRDESDTPSILYDVDNKEVLFNVVKNSTENNTLVYNEQALAFTSVYTFAPIYYCNLNGKMIVTKQWGEDAGLYKYNSSSDNSVMLFEEEAKPLLKYTVNKDASYNKVFDIQTFGGRFYKGDTTPLKFEYKTPLKQLSHTDGTQVTDREYDFRLAIPRNNDDMYGGRMRGKTIECTINSDSNDYDFSIQYITTKYRMSWS